MFNTVYLLNIDIIVMSNIGDWKCGCGYTNFKNRINCLKCNRHIMHENTKKSHSAPNDWTCLNNLCKEFNFGTRILCRKCNTPRKLLTQLSKNGDWICQQNECHEHNFSNRIICRKCGVGRDINMDNKENKNQTIPANFTSIKNDDWTCKNNDCNEYNFASRTICRKCNADRANPLENIKEVALTQINDSDTCVICYEKPKSHLIVTCSHLCFCYDCGSQLSVCPICRTPFDYKKDLIKVINC
jgi:hypothetical protein